MKIWVNTLVKNEERFIWYSVMSIVDYVDKILIWDTGSNDKTVEIIKEIIKIKGNKIDFKQLESVDKEEFTRLRQEMLDNSYCDFLILLDGDEVWWESSVKKLVSQIKKNGKNLDTIVTPYINLIGDIYHFQDESAGQYQIDGKIGFLTIRAVNRQILGLHFSNPYGSEGFYDIDNRLIQDRDQKKRLFLDTPYLHCTHLVRSSSLKKDKSVMQRGRKFKYEKGYKFPQDFKYPEVFYLPKPELVPNIWGKASTSFWLRAEVETVVKKAKRKIVKKNG